MMFLLLAACGSPPPSAAPCEIDGAAPPNVSILNDTPTTAVSTNLTVYGQAWRDDGAAVTSVIVLGQLVTTRVDDYSAWEVDLPIELLRAAADEAGDVWIPAIAEDFCGLHNEPVCEDPSDTADTGAPTPDCVRIPVAPEVGETPAR